MGEFQMLTMMMDAVSYTCDKIIIELHTINEYRQKGKSQITLMVVILLL